MIIKELVNKIINKISLRFGIALLFGAIFVGIVWYHWHVLDTNHNVKDFISNYACNIATECLGILVTVLSVQYLFDKHNARIEKQEELEKIARHHNIAFLYMKSYNKHLHCITTPIEERFKSDVKFETEFTLQDLQNMHTPVLLLDESLQYSSIKSFFECEQKLREVFVNMVSSIDFKFYPNLSELIENFIRCSIDNDVKNVILDYEILPYNQEEKLYKLYINRLKQENIYDDYKCYKKNELVSDGILAYFKLYDMLKEEQKILLSYIEEIKKLDS